MMVNITSAKTFVILCLCFTFSFFLLVPYALYDAHLVILVEQAFKAALVELVESGLSEVDHWRDVHNYFLPIH